MLDERVVKHYNQTRSVKDTKLLCHAPFSNIYFNTEGHVAVCWKTFHRHETYAPDRTIKDIWKGEEFEKIRQGIRDCNLDYGCQECKKHLLEGNYVNVLSKAYDNEHLHPVYPTIMELELSNQCNLACTMCNGNLSSIIRKNREKQPPLQSPYEEKFVEELNEFIPHLQEIRFNGGEPFLIKKYYDIWDNVYRLNPCLKMVIATNGTVLTSKVKDYMARANFHFNVSIDGMSAETYEKIRVGGNFEKLMENLEYFISYCKENDRTICIMINPMRQNWWEMPEFVNFCNRKGIRLWFNTIMKPAEQALWSYPASKLEEVYRTLSTAKLETEGLIPGEIQRYNIRTYKSLVDKQIKTWWNEALEREKSGNGLTIGENETVKEQSRKKILAYMGSARKEEAEFLLGKLEEVENTIESLDNRDYFNELILGSNPEVLLEMARELSTQDLMNRFQEQLKTSQ